MSEDSGQEPRYSEEEFQKALSDQKTSLNTGFSETLRNRVNELNANHAKESEKPKTRDFTRAELNAAVDDKKITQAEAETTWDTQQDRKTRETAQSIAADTVTRLDSDRVLQAEFSKYAAFDPDLLVEGSDSAIRARSEMTTQMTMMNLSEETLATQVLACRSVYGPANLLNENPERPRPTHQETTRGTGSSEGSGPSKDGWPEGLDAGQKAHYQGLMDMGNMTMEGVHAEQKYANKPMQKRFHARRA